MAKAAIEVCAKAHDAPLILTDAGLVNCEVSVDGSWQKWGYYSLNRVVTAMSYGTCLDVHVLSLSIVKDIQFGNKKRTEMNMKNEKLPISVI